jgi:hypothetical protein
MAPRWVESFEVHCGELGDILTVDHWKADGEQSESIFAIRVPGSIRPCPDSEDKFQVERGGYWFDAYRIHP